MNREPAVVHFQAPVAETLNICEYIMALIKLKVGSVSDTTCKQGAFFVTQLFKL